MPQGIIGTPLLHSNVYIKSFCLPGQLLPTNLALSSQTHCCVCRNIDETSLICKHRPRLLSMYSMTSAAVRCQHKHGLSCNHCTSDWWHHLPHQHTIRHSCACELHLPSCQRLLLQPQPQALLLSSRQQQQQRLCPWCLSCQHLLPLLLLLRHQLQPETCCSWWTCK
jgi:hypothetical protein